MKFKKIFIGLFTLSAIVCLASCKTDNKDNPGDDPTIEVADYTVDFNSMGGSSVSSQTIKRGSKVEEPTAPTRENYIFKGWYKDSSCTYPWDFNEDVVTGHVTLYAKWEEKGTPPTPVKKYSITYDMQGHGSAPDNVAEATALPNPLPTVEDVEGWHFVGWYLDEEFESLATAGKALTDHVTLYAKWIVKSETPETVRVIFNSNGGSNVSDATAIIGEKLKKPTDPVKDGYRFVGWFKDAECSETKEFNFNEEVITKGITLYAAWELAEYKVTFSGTSLKVQTVPVGGKVTKPADPVKANHTFAGWFEDAEYTKEFDFNTVLNGSNPNVTIYAKFEEKPQTDEDKQIKFPFKSFHQTAQANLDSSSGKTNKELTTGQFTVEAGVKTEEAILNTQGKAVTFTLNGKISNGIIFAGSGASKNNTVTVTLYKGETVLGTWQIEYQKAKTINVDGLDAGTYK
ncbi:MAG: InlB B-repeat-containing protein, partial [Anaeroplasmataceae bacterium]|nr:InlB B-repeat-containing protein [Anaeroplasmataceae bacterium]